MGATVIEHNPGRKPPTKDYKIEVSTAAFCSNRLYQEVMIEYPDQGWCLIQGVKPGEPKKIISTLKAYRHLARGSVGYLASVTISSSPAVRIQDIPVVQEYPDVFPEELLGMPPHREVVFQIDRVLSRRLLTKWRLLN